MVDDSVIMRNPQNLFIVFLVAMDSREDQTH